MKQNYNPIHEAITPARLTRAIEIAIKYADVSNAQIKVWLESEDAHAVINEICDLVKTSVDDEKWKKIKI